MQQSSKKPKIAERINDNDVLVQFKKNGKEFHVVVKKTDLRNIRNVNTSLHNVTARLATNRQNLISNKAKLDDAINRLSLASQ